MLPGVHRVRKPLASGAIAELWYAWRGGPRILRAEGRNEQALLREIARLTPAAVMAYEAERRPSGDGKFLYGLITRYLETPEFLRDLAPRTQRDRRKFLDKARNELGQLELRALEARGARAMLIKWRDRYQDTPKTADELLGSLGVVLQWATDRGEIAANPIKDFPRLYKVNRAEIVWEPHQLALLLKFADPEFAWAVRFAALTGIREGDLINVPWSAVGENAIVWQTGKSRGRRTIVVPITQDLRALLAEIPKRATTILASSRKKPWKASGLSAGLRRARIAVLEHVQKVHGPEATSPIEGLRIHDLRGTAATNFIRAGLDLADVATILGWKLDRVREIAARYVTAEAIGLAIVQRLDSNAKRTKAVNRAVNRAS